MSRIKSGGTKPEMIVRRMVHRLGYRYRLHRKGLPGRPDLVFVGRRKIIFVHGCFWHQHDDPACGIARVPKSRLEYWLPKLQRNADRDRSNVETLRASGWSIMTVWQCQVRDELELERRIREFLG